MNLILNNRAKIIFFINIILILSSAFLNSNLLLVHLFYLVYAIIIHKNFSNNIRRYLYFIVLFYSIVTSGNSKYVFVFYGFYMFILLYEYFKNRFIYSGEKFRKYFCFFIIFIVYMIFSVFIAKDKVIAIRYLFKYAIMISLFFMMILENSNIKNLKQTLKFLLYIYIGILFLGVLELFGVKYGLRNIFLDKEMHSYYLNRIPEVFFYNPNNYSVVLNIGIICIFVKTLFNKENNLLYYALILISEVQLIFARSRLAWGLLFISFAFITFFGILNLKKNNKIAKICIKKSLIAFFMSFILFFSLAVVPGMQPYYNKISNSVVINKIRESIFSESNVHIYDEESGDSSNSKIKIGGKGSENERVTLMYNVIDGVIVKKNFFGFGVGNIGVYIKEKSNTYGIVNVHSFWFEYLGDFGVVMFIYLIVMYLYMLIDMLKLYIISNNKQYFLMFLTVGITMILSAFSPSTVLLFSPFWIILGICFSLVSNKDNYKTL